MPSYLLEILQSHLIVIPYTPPKPNKQQFAPENGWLQDVCNFLLETFYFQNLSLLSRRGCIIRSTRWWFQTFFEFSPRSLGNDPIWQTRIFFKICWQKNTKLHPLFRGRELPGPCFFFFEVSCIPTKLGPDVRRSSWHWSAMHLGVVGVFLGERFDATKR